MNTLIKLISWTGWTKEDWKNFLYIFTPMNLMSKTGWTWEEWKDTFKGAGCSFVLIMSLYAVFCSGLGM